MTNYCWTFEFNVKICYIHLKSRSVHEMIVCMMVCLVTYVSRTQVWALDTCVYLDVDHLCFLNFGPGDCGHNLDPDTGTWCFNFFFLKKVHFGNFFSWAVILFLKLIFFVLRVCFKLPSALQHLDFAQIGLVFI